MSTGGLRIPQKYVITTVHVHPAGVFFSLESHENSVLVHAITFPGGLIMSDYELIHYYAAIAQGHVMLEKGLITEHEFSAFEEKMHVKYNLPKISIYRDKRLLYRDQ